VRRPLLLDLFCGAGGAAMGYHRAGFDVVGVDIAPQPHYPFEFVQGDALSPPVDLSTFDAIHASPPCQAYSTTASLHRTAHPDLYLRTRSRLCLTGKPWVIENVIGAPYGWGTVLCGGMFGLRVRRHRNFESSLLLMTTEHRCPSESIDVTGTGGRSERKDKSTGGEHRKPRSMAEASEAMGIDWMTRREISQAIPPAYTEWIGSRLIESLAPVAATEP
jgi:DNA (cytosine-5)-methyltransferase 1